MICSILYRDGAEYSEFDQDGFFHDLRIDAILDEILSENYTQAGAYYRRKPARPEDVCFRLDVMKDLERPDIRSLIREFTTSYSLYRAYRAYSDTLPQRQTRQKWLLDAACVYCACLGGLRSGLEAAGPASEGLRRFLERMAEYMDSDGYASLRGDAEACAGRLSAVRYTMDIQLYRNRISVRPGCESAGNYCERLLSTFSRYGIAASSDMAPFPGVNLEPLELAVMDRLCNLYPDELKRLDDFCARHPSWDSELADAFAAELEFYLAYLHYMDRLRQKGYTFAYPVFTERKAVKITAGYDLSLAQCGDARVTPNDLTIEAGECCVVTGPNRGGKTSFARTLGQVLYFASLGLPAPCGSVEIFFVEAIGTHFAREEDLSNNAGRLKEELQRTKRMLDTLPPNSVIVFNDLLASTATADALAIGGKLLSGITLRGLVCLFVTNFHELARESPDIICLHAVSDDERKSFRVTREPTGQASQNRLMADYRLTYEDIRSRVQ